MTLQQAAEVQDRRLVRERIGPCQPTETAHGLGLVEQVPYRRDVQAVAELHTEDAQYQSQEAGPPSVPRLGIDQFDSRLQHDPWYPADIEYLFLHIPLVTLNGLVHYRLLTNRPVTWRWMLALSAMDIVLITGGIVIGGGFNSFIFLAYYATLAVFAAIFTSFWLGMAWTTITAVIYTIVSLGVGSGLDRDAGQDTVLVSRLVVMYAIVICITLITRFQRIRRIAAVENERNMQQERIELSQMIHDTAAQTAYMIGMGIHRARKLADESNEELVAALDATYVLSKEAMWELRHPIDAGRIFEDRELGRVLWSHCETFERITAVPAKMTQSGTEPPLVTETRARLLSIAHNALTNAFQHARPDRVEVRLSVSDGGVGLPDEYAERGRGINGMRAGAEKIGGKLIVESSKQGGGTTITCIVPREADERGG